jgi:hypothetical protein
MVSDRSTQSVTIADKNTIRSAGLFPPASLAYHVASIRESLFGINQGRMEFAEEQSFVRENWDAIVDMFSPERRAATHERLSTLGRERLKRELAPWPSAILDFELFLQSKGLTRESREAPDGALGRRLMQYAGDIVCVKIDSEDGWRLTVSDRINRPDAEYHIGTIRKYLLGDVKTKLAFQEWFIFAGANWEAIVELFSASKREDSHRSLQPIEAETRRQRQIAKDRQKAQIEEFARRLKLMPQEGQEQK